MEQMYTFPAKSAQKEFIRWMSQILLKPETALKHGNVLIGIHDWNRSLNLEIGKGYTKSGIPEVYTFKKEDMLKKEI